MIIPVFALNLKSRHDRKQYILQQFCQKKEFEVHIIEAIEHTNGAIGLWKSITHVLQNLVDSESDYIILCEDDHEFTQRYCCDVLYECIWEAQEQDADILSGGVSWFKTGIQVSKNLFWIEKFSGLQFTVIFKKFYQTILDAPFTELDQADYKISDLTDKKFVIYPFMSIQKDFGYSDVTRRNHEERRVERLFEEASERFFLLQKVKTGYSNCTISNFQLTESVIEPIDLPLYVITEKLNFNPCSDIIFFGFSCTTIQIPINHYPEQWRALCKCIDLAKKNEDDFIIITFDSFVLKKNFKKFILINNIIKSGSYGCDVLLGNVDKFNHAVPIDESIFWIDSFSQSSFIVLFAGAYEKVSSNPPAPDEPNIYNYLSYVTSNKMAVYPFVSESRNLIKGYESNIKFQEYGNQLAVYQRIYQEYILKERV